MITKTIYTQRTTIILDIAEDVSFDRELDKHKNHISLLEHELEDIKRKALGTFNRTIHQNGKLFFLLAHAKNSSKNIWEIYDENKVINLQEYLKERLQEEKEITRAFVNVCNPNNFRLQNLPVPTTYPSKNIGFIAQYNDKDFIQNP